MRSPILEFPLHSGLNFRTLPWLESLPWFPQLQVPYSSTMRRSQALWQIVGRFYSVGVWKWLISWPAETVHGFYVSGGVGWAQFGDGDKRREVREKSTYPSRLYRDLTKPEPLNVEERMQELAGDGLHIEADERKWNPLRGLVQDRVAHYLPQLIERFEPRFVAAAFFNLDVFHHFYGRSEGSEKELIAKSYRYVDARLGELLEELDRPVQLIVISDHGFDFEHGHHTFAPPGIFIAHGPAFGPGERVEGLSVYDVAPLVLRLLDLPLAEDMRGTRQGRYERALRPDFLGAHPVSYLDSWEGEESADEDDEKHPIDDQMRDVLESLGYIG